MAKEFDFIIGGFIRSGTTLIRMLIDSHPECFVGPESKVFYPKNEIEQICINWYNKKLGANFNKENFNEENLVTKLHETHPDIKFFGEKSPRNSRYYNYFLKNTNKKVIHVHRDPESTFKSICKIKGRNLNYHNFKLQWDELNKCIDWEENDRFIKVSYEDLCENLDENLDKIFDFIGADTNIDYHEMRKDYPYENVNKEEWENSVDLMNIVKK